MLWLGADDAAEELPWTRLVGGTGIELGDEFVDGGREVICGKKFICKGGNRGGSHCMAQASRANNEAERLYLYVRYSIFHVLSIASWLFGCCEPQELVVGCPHAKNRPCVSLCDIRRNPLIPPVCSPPGNVSAEGDSQDRSIRFVLVVLFFPQPSAGAILSGK